MSVLPPLSYIIKLCATIDSINRRSAFGPFTGSECALRLRVTVCYCECVVRTCGLQSTVKYVRDFGVNFFIAEVTSNCILDWTSILQRKGQGGSKSFTEINILFMRYCAFYLPDLAKSEWLCGMNAHHLFFQRQRREVAPSHPPVS